MEIKGTCHCEKVNWRYSGELESATACNCTICRRYGSLWAYGYCGEEIEVSGEVSKYRRGRSIDFNFCSNCGCLAYYQSQAKDEKGRLRTAVNLRMVTDPKAVTDLIVRHFEGLEAFEDLPSDGRRVKDLWF